jgi:hypothetical protein
MSLSLTQLRQVSSGGPAGRRSVKKLMFYRELAFLRSRQKSSARQTPLSRGRVGPTAPLPPGSMCRDRESRPINRIESSQVVIAMRMPNNRIAIDPFDRPSPPFAWRIGPVIGGDHALHCRIVDHFASRCGVWMRPMQYVPYHGTRPHRAETSFVRAFCGAWKLRRTDRRGGVWIRVASGRPSCFSEQQFPGSTSPRNIDTVRSSRSPILLIQPATMGSIFRQAAHSIVLAHHNEMGVGEAAASPVEQRNAG